MNVDREAILDDELIRITPGLRPFSAGILTFCGKLGLQIAGGEKPPGSPRELRIIAWLLDERNPLDAVKAAVASPRPLFDEIIDAYEFTISPAFLVKVKAEVARTNRAVEAASAFAIEPKPDAREGPQPVGKS